jgi:membrane fusion protein, epimerase transport system
VPDNSEIVVTKQQRGGITRLEKAIAAQGSIIDHDIDAPKRIGLILVAIVFGFGGLWSVLAPIEGAATAPGQVTVKSFKKPVQHLEGGIVKAVHVHDGDHVEAGAVLLEMDNTQSLSQLDIYTAQLKAHLALEARLIAERDGTATIAFPSELVTTDTVAAKEMAAQSQLFDARVTTYKGEVAVLQQRIGQLESRVGGLKAVKASKTALATSYGEEVKDFQLLLKEGFADKIRLRELERSFALASGEAAELTSTIAATDIQIGETKLEILQLQNRIQSEVAGQLAEAQTRLQDVRERVRALTDVVSRTEVRAPEGGVVNGLKVHTQGTVVGPGTVIAEIVPQSDELVIEARVSPMDIDRVARGQEARMRMVSLNSRTVPTLYGTLTELSADALTDPEGAQYFLARLALKPESLAELRDQKLLPGMPAEVQISTGSRTFMQYLMKPLSDSVARSFRED